MDERLGEDREVTDGIATRERGILLVDMERLPPAARRDLGKDIEMTNYVELGLRVRRLCRLVAPMFVVLFRILF